MQGKIVLVTGASRGIGQAIALALGAQGAIVYGSATSPAGADKISAAFEQAGIKGRGLVMDVTNEETITAGLKTIEAAHGSVEILVNNAGITRDNILMRMKDDEWDAVIDTNLKSIYRLSKACIRAMVKARWGRIINISSVIGLMGGSGQANYAAAKAGVIGFSKSLAREVASRNITVNVVAPGMIETDMTDALGDDIRKTILENIPAARYGSVNDIAAAVCFLASDGAAYITGETLNVNGGMHME